MALWGVRPTEATCTLAPTQGGVCVLQVLLVDEPISVLVHQCEGLLELLDLRLLEVGKDVG